MNGTARNWKIIDLIRTTTEYFETRQIENPRLNAEQLLGSVLDMPRVQLYVSFERPVRDDELTRFRELVRRRSRHEPLQYIVGHTEFMGLPFGVNPSVLIPRPETETLVEEALKLKPFFMDQAVKILEIGSGSGCVAVSLAHFWPEAQILATDVLPAALQTALENARLNGLENTQVTESTDTQKIMDSTRLLFQQHDIFKGWPDGWPPQMDIIVSNPPYIARSELAGLPREIRDYEPVQALSDDADGMRFYGQICHLALGKDHPKARYVLMEMSGTQNRAIIDMVKQLPFKQVETIRDLNQIERIIKIKVTDG